MTKATTQHDQDGKTTGVISRPAPCARARRFGVGMVTLPSRARGRRPGGSWPATASAPHPDRPRRAYHPGGLASKTERRRADPAPVTPAPRTAWRPDRHPTPASRPAAAHHGQPDPAGTPCRTNATGAGRRSTVQGVSLPPPDRPRALLGILDGFRRGRYFFWGRYGAQRNPRQGETTRTDGKGVKGRIALKCLFYWPLFAFGGV